MNRSLSKKLRLKQLKNTHFIFKDIIIRNEFGMITTPHTFERDLKWNLHIHCLVSDLVYSQKTNRLKMSTILIFSSFFLQMNGNCSLIYYI